MSFNMPGPSVSLSKTQGSWIIWFLIIHTALKMTWLWSLRILNIVTLGYIICPCLLRQCAPRICLAHMKFRSPFLKSLLLCSINQSKIDWLIILRMIVGNMFEGNLGRPGLQQVERPKKCLRLFQDLVIFQLSGCCFLSHLVTACNNL